MNDDSLSFVFGVILLAILCVSPLMYSKEREILRLHNNFIARMNNNNWDQARKMLADEFFWQPYSDDPLKVVTVPGGKGWESFYTIIDTTEDLAAVAYDVKNVSQMNERQYTVACEMQLRCYDPMRNSNVFWNATMTWTLTGAEWRLASIKDTSPRRKIQGI